MKFMLDHNLSPLLARALNELSGGSGNEVVALRDKFPQGTKDAQWMGQLGGEGGWAVVCGDRGILADSIELKAWRESKLTIFFLARGWSSFDHWAKAAKLIKCWPKIESQARDVLPGVSYIVHVNGKLEVIP